MFYSVLTKTSNNSINIIKDNLKLKANQNRAFLVDNLNFTKYEKNSTLFSANIKHDQLRSSLYSRYCCPFTRKCWIPFFRMVRTMGMVSFHLLLVTVHSP